jgi:hypothetical protein
MPGDRRLAPLIAALALFALASQSDQFSSSRDGGASSLLAEDAAPPTEGSSSVLASAADHAGATAADATATDDVGAAWGGQYDDYTSEYRGATDSPFELEIDLRQYVVVAVFVVRRSFSRPLGSFVHHIASQLGGPAVTQKNAAAPAHPLDPLLLPPPP